MAEFKWGGEHVSQRQPGESFPERGERHPLLFHQRFSEQNFWPSTLILALSAGLLLWNPDKLAPFRAVLMLALAGTGLVLVLTLVFRLRAYAQCLADALRVQLPFHQLTIPYHEIKSARPTELFRIFPPSQQRWPQRRFLRSLFGETVVVIEMEEFPSSVLWLRLWMNKYMLCPDRVGLILAVRDWLAFRAELDEFTARRQRLRR